MKKLFLLALCLVSCLLVSCGDETTSNSAVPLNDFDKTGTLQGTILDATTGERIGGTDLEVILIQGTQHRNPDKLITDVTDSLVGEYAFSNIPIALYDNVTYKIVVTNGGYQRFEAEFTLDAVNGGGTLVDNNYNFIGNIYLFPVGATADDIVIYVEDGNGARVTGATVQLEQDVENNLMVNGTNSRLLPDTGLIPVLTATTDADGVATFSGADLVLGGKYNPVVLPITLPNGLRTALTAGNDITVGMDIPSQVIELGYVEPALLFVVYASNRDTTSITADGSLEIVFNRTVYQADDSTALDASVDASILCDTDGDGNSDDVCPNAVLDATDTATATFTTSGGYTTLTLTPNYTGSGVAPDVTLGDVNAVITYSDVYITIDTIDPINVFTVDYTDGSSVSNKVNVTGMQ